MRARVGNFIQRQLRQVFIARSRALCAQVKRMVESGLHEIDASLRSASNRNELSAAIDDDDDASGNRSGAAMYDSAGVASAGRLVGSPDI